MIECDNGPHRQPVHWLYALSPVHTQQKLFAAGGSTDTPWMVHGTSSVQPLQLSLETSTGGVIGHEEHNHDRVVPYISILRSTDHGMSRALGAISLGERDSSISKGFDIKREPLGLSPALKREHLPCRSGPVRATRASGSFHMLSWTRSLGGDSRGILRPQL